MNEPNTNSDPTQATVGGTTFEAFPPQGFAQVVPDLPALEGADVVVAPTVFDGVILIDSAAIATVALPHEQAWQHATTITGVDHLTGDDLTEYTRLVTRFNAQPTSEQSKQELNSFKQLHALA